MEKKMTKVEAFETLRDMVEASDIEQHDELLEFIDTQVEQLHAKAEKAKARAAEKKAKGDELREAVLQVLTAEFQTIDQILEMVEGEDLTRAKISSRLTQLVNSGDAEKEQLKLDGRKVMGYRLVGGTSEG